MRQVVCPLPGAVFRGEREAVARLLRIAVDRTGCRGCSVCRDPRRSGSGIDGPFVCRRSAGPVPPCCCRRTDRRGKTPARLHRHRLFRVSRRDSIPPAGTFRQAQPFGTGSDQFAALSHGERGQGITDAVIHAPQLRINFTQQPEVGCAVVDLPDAGIAGIGIGHRCPIMASTSFLRAGRTGRPNAAGCPSPPARSR